MEATGDDGATIEDYVVAGAAMAIATAMMTQAMIYGEPLAPSQRERDALVMWLASDPVRPRVAMFALQSPTVTRTRAFPASGSL